jgi:ubiquinone/menaquinone biosynthesis C-methylase UbiE
VTNVTFAYGDGTALPFADGAFDLVLSHSVIEHVANPLEYLREARRVLAPGGAILLSTAPYLSSSGSHLPKYNLPFPLPLHLIVGRTAAFAAARWIGAHKPHWFEAESRNSTFVSQPRSGRVKSDDLLYRATIRNLRTNIRRAGLQSAREDLAISRLVTRFAPARIAATIPAVPLVRDILVTNMEYVLVRTDGDAGS